jgi:hypothetical protein
MGSRCQTFLALEAPLFSLKHTSAVHDMHYIMYPHKTKNTKCMFNAPARFVEL